MKGLSQGMRLLALASAPQQEEMVQAIVAVHAVYWKRCVAKEAEVC